MLSILPVPAGTLPSTTRAWPVPLAAISLPSSDTFRRSAKARRWYE